jgi:Tfp pilus assembly protein PilF
VVFLIITLKGEEYMSTRLEQLIKLAGQAPDDAFIQYAMALEYVSNDDLEEAATTLENLMAKSPNYSAGYHQAGRVYEQLERIDDARRCYEKGVVVAEQQGDTKDRDEMRGSLLMLD